MSGAADYILPVALIGGAAFAIWYLFKNGAGGLLQSGAATANAQSVQQNTQAVAAALPTAGTTLSDAQLNGIATAIANTTDSVDVMTALRQLGSTADFNRVYQLFGTKQGSLSSISTCALLGFDCQSFDLVSWVDGILDSAEKASINSLLAANGINAQF